MAGTANTDAKDTGSPEDAETDAEETFDPERAKAKITKTNSENANLRRRVRELEAAEAELAKIKDADKTEGQKALEAAQAAEARANKAEADLMRLNVAMDKGLTPAQAKRLVGDTVEALEADADDLLEQFGLGKKSEAGGEDTSSSSSSTPKRPERPRPANLTGPAGEDDDAPFDADAVAKRHRQRNVIR